MKTAIYVRVSTEEQARDGFSIHAQKDKLTKYAELNDWEIVDYYIDDGVSGKNLTDRKEVSRLLRDVQSGRVRNVLVYKLDRLTRSVKDLIYLIELFDLNNCTFNSQTEKIDTSNAVGRMFVKIIGIFAEFERENLAERVSFGYEQKTREGNYTNCNGVFGYDYLLGGNIKVNKDESYYVNKIYDWYLNGESMLSIAKKLKDLGIPTKRGGQWKSSTIKSILTNPLYIGNVRYGVNKRNGFEVVGKDIESVVSKNLFYSVQNLISGRARFTARKFSSDETYFFKVLVCNKCGGSYQAKQQMHNGKKYITYQCRGHANGVCDAPGFSHSKLENSFLEFLGGILDLQYSNLPFNVRSIDYSTLESVDNIFNHKLIISKSEVKELKFKGKEYLINKLRGITLNVKNNYMYLTSHEKKMFLERFIKNITVEKKNNKVVICDVCFE